MSKKHIFSYFYSDKTSKLLNSSRIKSLLQILNFLCVDNYSSFPVLFNCHLHCDEPPFAWG